MASNVTTAAVVSGVPIGTQIALDDVGGGLLVQRVKVAHGPTGSATDVSTSSPLPVQAALATDVLLNNLVPLTPKFAVITASASGVTQVVAAVGGKKIRVLSWTLVCSGAVNVKWQSAVTPTDLTGLHYFAANGGASPAFDPFGHFQTLTGEALNINLSGATAVGGSLQYVEV